MLKKVKVTSLDTLATILTVVSLVIALVSWLWPFSYIPKTSSIGTSQNEEVLKIQINSLKSELAELKKQIAGLSNIPAESQLNSRLGLLEASASDLDSRLTEIENVILQSPAEALELTLLRQQLINDEKNYQNEVDRLNMEIDRLYSLLVGSLVALLITIIGPRLMDIAKREQGEKTNGK